MEILSFNGYQGSVETSINDGVVFGKILFIADLVNYEAQTLPELKQAFEEAVQDYIDTCRQLNKRPDKPATGQFNVRVGEALHQRAILRSMADNTSLNAVITNALSAYLDQAPVLNHIHKHEHVVTVQVGKSQSVWTTPGSGMQFLDRPGEAYVN